MTKVQGKNKTDTFCYLLPDDPYYVRIMAAILDELITRKPNSRHIFWPIYGIRHKHFRHGILRTGIIASYQQNKRLQSLATTRLKEYSSSFGSYKEKQYIRIIDPMQWAASRFMHIQANDLDDLLIDTYIRFSSEPYPNRDDPFWHQLTSLASRYAAFASSLERAHNFRAIFGSYTSYIYHGVPQRTFLAHGKQTITMGCLQEFARIHRPYEQRPLHTADYLSYRKKITTEVRLAKWRVKAEASLDSRITGQRDETTLYMRSKSGREADDISLKGSRVIFLHDFFDSSHIYRWHIFESHYDWAIKTIDFLVLNGISVHIKPHPNAILESHAVVEKLKERYLSNDLVKWLDSNVTNQSIFARNPSLAISVYGSVAAEAAYAGIPCLMAGDHPGSCFNIGRTSTSQEDYFKHLLKPPKLTGSEKREAIDYIAAHNYNIYEKTGCSLWSYLGKSPSFVDENPQILKGNEAEFYIRSECSRLIDMVLCNNA